MEISDRVTERYGPLRINVEVVEINERGAVVKYLPETMRYVGWETVQFANDGTQLTPDRQFGFIGRAHWPHYDQQATS